MKRRRISLATHLLACVALVATERVGAHLLADSDPVAQLLVQRSGGWLAALSCLLALRVVVLFLIPGWLVWLALSTALRWRRRNRRFLVL